jgi:DNA ligase D-like protein (predicted 3'-phosphoesterase)
MPKQHESLRKYRAKRDFERTPEPSGSEASAGSKPIFVVQQHAARRLHYDFRLEVDGVLKSWAVPRGPSLDPREKRLAMPTEDHPMEYASFEGNIPRGEYGAGTVMVWDTGTYRNLKEEHDRPLSMAEGLAGGHATVWLEGKKLRGGFALVRTRPEHEDDEERWLLVKMDDEEADIHRDIVEEEPASVLTGRTMEQIAREGERKIQPVATRT